MKRSREQLVGLMGIEVVRFQDESAAFDDVAARILALERGDLPCMTRLLFGGPAFSNLEEAVNGRARVPWPDRRTPHARGLRAAGRTPARCGSN
jgi:hypothetical protein